MEQETSGASSQRVQIAPSILAGDFLHLQDSVDAAVRGGADRLHLDVMDGRFVPNLTLGPQIVKAIDSVTQIPLEVHLMIVEPERYISVFADAGADIITVHSEVSPHLFRTLEQIHDLGKQAGVAINPATHWIAVEEVLQLADLILVMTVSPGFGGQEFVPDMTRKIAALRRTIDRRGLGTELEVDGGISEHNIGVVARAGARVIVAGTAVYGAADGVERSIRTLRQSAEEAIQEAHSAISSN